MQDVRNQRLMAIKRMDGHTYRAILWLRENRHRFKQDILEPIMLIVSELGCIQGVHSRIGTCTYMYVNGPFPPSLPPSLFPFQMNLKDQRYSSQVEAFFGGKDALSFVALNEEDKETFLVEVSGRTCTHARTHTHT